MKKGIKVFIAGSIIWLAFVTTINASFDWKNFPWERYASGELMALYTLPPITLALSYWMMKWAFGPEFLEWLKSNKPKVSSLLFFVIISFAAINAGVAAGNSEDAYDIASEANDNAQEAVSAARECSSR
jgi:hypothetical protein